MIQPRWTYLLLLQRAPTRLPAPYGRGPQSSRPHIAPQGTLLALWALKHEFMPGNAASLTVLVRVRLGKAHGNRQPPLPQMLQTGSYLTMMKKCQLSLVPGTLITPQQKLLGLTLKLGS